MTHVVHYVIRRTLNTGFRQLELHPSQIRQCYHTREKMAAKLAVRPVPHRLHPDKVVLVHRVYSVKNHNLTAFAQIFSSTGNGSLENNGAAVEVGRACGALISESRWTIFVTKTSHPREADQATRRSSITGRCLRPSKKPTIRTSRAPVSPLIFA